MHLMETGGFGATRRPSVGPWRAARRIETDLLDGPPPCRASCKLEISSGCQRVSEATAAELSRQSSRPPGLTLAGLWLLHPLRVKQGLDTNVLVYAHIPEFEVHDRVREFLLGQLGATLLHHDVEEVTTYNERDFAVFEGLRTVDPVNRRDGAFREGPDLTGGLRPGRECLQM